MPTRESIVNTMIPKEVEKPIPVRVVSTRAPAIKTPSTEPSRDQQSTITGTTSVADSASTADSVKLSPQLSALARKEQAHRQKEQAFKEREKALEAKLAEAEKYIQLKTKLSNKDFSELESLGLSYEDYTKYLLDKQGQTDPQKQELKKLADEMDALKKSQEENADREYKETVAEYKKEIGALIANDPSFSSVKELKREDAVLQLILDSWEEDSEEMTIEQAAKLVEDYSVEEAKQFSSLSKLKPKEETAVKLPPPKSGLKTLTQQVVAPSGKQPPKNLQYLSESERYAEARRRVLERKQQ